MNKRKVCKNISRSLFLKSVWNSYTQNAFLLNPMDPLMMAVSGCLTTTEHLLDAPPELNLIVSNIGELRNALFDISATRGWPLPLVNPVGITTLLGMNYGINTLVFHINGIRRALQLLRDTPEWGADLQAFRERVDTFRGENLALIDIQSDHSSDSGSEASPNIH